MSPEDQALWQAYTTTVFSAPHRLEWGTFGILTAWNPGVFLSFEENRGRNQELASELQSLGLVFEVIFAGSPDGEHLEPSWAVQDHCESARTLACRWGQNAIFWVERDRLHLVGCRPGWPDELELGAFSPRWLAWEQVPPSWQAEFLQSSG